MPSQSIESLIASVREATGASDPGRRYPPVDQWSPPDCGDIGMEIRADGSWWHAGGPITRQPLIDLFATVLRKDIDGTTWLVTPHEKVPVAVADAAFRAVRVDRQGDGIDQTILATTNLGDIVSIGTAHPLRVEIANETRQPRPYVTVRGRLEALLTRAAFLELADWGVEHAAQFGIWSQGAFFAIDEAPIDGEAP